MRLLTCLLTFFISISASAQLFVRPTTDDGSFVFIDGTYLYVEEDINLEKNETASDATTRQYANIIVRDKGQLLQRNNSLNDGTGVISIFQEGVADGYEHNYWHSPVGVSEPASTVAPAGNSYFAFQTDASQRILHNPQSVGISIDAVVQPESGGYTGTVVDGGDLNIASYWFFKYSSGTAYSGWTHVNETGIVEPGYGFTMKGVNGIDNTSISTEDVPANNLGENQRYDFVGRPNNGTIDVSIAPGNFVLTGNPYPSALDLSYFLLQNSGTGTFDCGTITSVPRTDVLTGMAYFWDQDPTINSHYLEEYQAGYGVYSPMGTTCSSGVYTPADYVMYDANGDEIPCGSCGSGSSYDRRFSPVGQGFFVQAVPTPANPTFRLENAQRVYVEEGNNSDFKNNTNQNEVVPVVGINANYPDANAMEPVPQFRLLAQVNDTFTRNMAVAFAENATQGIDPAMDGLTLNQLSVDISFTIEEQGGYVINAIPYDDSLQLPLKVVSNGESEIIFSTGQEIAFPFENIYLWDKLENSYHDIRTDRVLFRLDAGDHSERFYVVFKNEADNDDEDGGTLSIEDSIAASFEIFQNNQLGELTVKNPKGEALASISLYDMAGKQVFAKQQLGTVTEHYFNTSALSAGIYVVTIITEKGLLKVRKVSVTQN